MYILKLWASEWAIGVYRPIFLKFSYMMARTSYIEWDNDVSFVLGQLDFIVLQYTQVHIVVDHLQRWTACHVWLGVYRCLLIAHLLCEYLIVAKLGVVKFVPEGDKAMTYMYLFLNLFNHTLQF